MTLIELYTTYLSTGRMRIQPIIISIILIPLLSLGSLAVGAVNTIPKSVYLIFDEDRIIASNIEFNRFDKIQLTAKEEVLESAVGKAVIVVVTNKRILGYSVKTSRWVKRNTLANETVESILAEDYSALVNTSKRFLSFNGLVGVWSETPRKKVFD